MPEARRSLPQVKASPDRRSFQPFPPHPRRALTLLPAEDRVSEGLLLGLIAVTLPAVVYSLLQTWNLVGGDTLNHAIRAFVP